MVQYGNYHEIPSVNYLPVTAQVPLCGDSPPKSLRRGCTFCFTVLVRFNPCNGKTSGPISVRVALLHSSFSTALCTIATITTIQNASRNNRQMAHALLLLFLLLLSWWFSRCLKLRGFFLTSPYCCWLLLLHESHRAACSTALESVSFWPRLSSI